MTRSGTHTQWMIVGCVLLPLVVSLACNPSTGGTSPDAPPEEVSIEQNLAFGPGTFTFMDPQAGLAELSSYTASLTVTFDGTREGTPLNWSRTYTMLAMNQPHARQWTIEQTGASPTAMPVFLAELDGANYEQREEAACSATEIQEGDSLTGQLELAAFLTGVIGAEEAGAEQVNEIATMHYAFDERALGEEGFSKSSGEVWVADEGGYILRYRLTSTPREEYVEEGSGGTITLAYELTAPNQPVTIGLPEDCPPGMIDAPLMQDAVDVFKAPGLLTYATATGLAEAAAFYQERIPGLGWKSSGDSSVTETEAFLNFERGDRHMTIVLDIEEGRTTVNIIVTRRR